MGEQRGLFIRAIPKHTMRYFWGCCFSIAAFLILSKDLAAVTSAKKISASQYLTKAKSEFSKEHYRLAIKFYKKYLRKNPKDYPVWNQLAVSYYHAAELERALALLKRLEKKGGESAYNAYYQALIHEELGQGALYMRYLIRAARFRDRYAAKATYELAVVHYQNKDKQAAQYWINLYKQRYPKGPHIRVILLMENSLNSGVWLEGLQKNPRPDFRKSLFENHRFSLTNRPHYWFLDLSYDYTFGQQADPAPINLGGVRKQGYNEQDFRIYSGLGLGPIEKDKTLAQFGYHYKQDWITNNERWADFLDSLSSGAFAELFRYLPFRTDLLQRTHELYANIHYKISEQYSLDLHLEQDFTFIGSTLIPQEDNVSQKSAQVAQTSLVTLGGTYQYSNRYRTKFALYFRKKINYEMQEFSNKTYSLFGSGSQTPLFSFTLLQEINLAERQLYFDIYLFKIDYIYNDYLEDYSRIGLLGQTRYRYWKGFWLNAGVGYVQDQYTLPIIRQGGCREAPLTADQQLEQQGELVKCPRVDTGMMFRIGLAYDQNRFRRYWGRMTYYENKNPNLLSNEYNFMSFEIGVTWAFPDVSEVQLFIRKDTDVVYDKREQ